MRIWVITWGCYSAVQNLEKLWMIFIFPWPTEVLQLSPEDLDPHLGGWMSPSINAPKCFDLEKSSVIKVWKESGCTASKLSKVMNETSTARLRDLYTHARLLQVFIDGPEMGGEIHFNSPYSAFKDGFSLSLNARRPFLWDDFQWAGAPWAQQMISSLF